MTIIMTELDKLLANTDIPESEILEIRDLIFSHPQYFSTAYVAEYYKKLHLDVLPSPFTHDVIDIVKKALLSKKALAVMRMGDGEMNFLTYNKYNKTPELNKYAVEKIISIHSDRFKITPHWITIIQDLLETALRQADVLGVLGLWREKPIPDHAIPHVLKIIYEAFLKDPRGISGHWRGLDYMMQLADEGRFTDKTIASAHLYFAIIDYIDELIPCTKTVHIISSREDVYKLLKDKHTNSAFHYIRTGEENKHDNSTEPIFLSTVRSHLPADMTGSLSLVGAGQWANIYCAWIKELGGVAVNIGSGMDLLDGKTTRGIHQALSSEQLEKFSLHTAPQS